MGSVDGPGGEDNALSISGELDVGSVTAVKQKIAAVRQPVVRVDTAGLTFIDSTGLAGLLDAQAAIESDGRRLELVNCPPPLTRLLEITALTDRFSSQRSSTDDIAGPDPSQLG